MILESSKVAGRVLPLNYCLDQQVYVHDFEYVLHELSEEKYQCDEKFEIVMDHVTYGYPDDSDNLWILYARFSNLLQKINSIYFWLADIL